MSPILSCRVTVPVFFKACVDSHSCVNSDCTVLSRRQHLMVLFPIIGNIIIHPFCLPSAGFPDPWKGWYVLLRAEHSTNTCFHILMSLTNHFGVSRALSEWSSGRCLSASINMYCGGSSTVYLLSKSEASFLVGPIAQQWHVHKEPNAKNKRASQRWYASS